MSIKVHNGIDLHAPQQPVIRDTDMAQQMAQYQQNSVLELLAQESQKDTADMQDAIEEATNESTPEIVSPAEENGTLKKMDTTTMLLIGLGALLLLKR